MPDGKTNAERILVVDDEEAMCEIIASMLSAAGFTVSPISSVRQALAVLETAGEFDLLLADLMMAELDGIALLERVKERYPDMPVVIVSGAGDISAAIAAIRSGAYDYLLKPFKREQLLAIVRRAVQHRRQRLENRAYQINLESLVAARTEQLRQSLTDLERAYDTTLEVLGNAMGLRDREVEAHSRRVTAFTIAIARAMGLSGERIRVIARGAFLHDVGLLAVPEAILQKPRGLTAEETAIVREHCAHGYETLRKVPFLAEASEIVYAHQEHYDGTGYPRGLRGDEIHIGARIVAVAATLDKITSRRSYQELQTLAAAREEIIRCSGSQFDPAVVETFCQMPDAIWEDLRRQIDSHNYSFAHPMTALRGEEKPSRVQ